MSRQAAFGSGRSSPTRRGSSPSGGTSGTAPGTSGLLASLRARTAGFRDSAAAAGGESPSGSLASSYVLTGGGIADTARTLFSSFSGGPGDQGDMGGFEGFEEQVDFGGEMTEGLLGLESLTLGGTGGEGDGLGLYHYQNLDAICGGKVGSDEGRICGKPPAECTAQSHASSRDETRLRLLVDKVLVRGKAVGASKALYVDPAIAYDTFRAYPGAAELMNMQHSRETWKLIFKELEDHVDGGLAGTLATMPPTATPARKVRFREDAEDGTGDGAEGSVAPDVFVEQVARRIFASRIRGCVDIFEDDVANGGQNSIHYCITDHT